VANAMDRQRTLRIHANTCIALIARQIVHSNPHDQWNETQVALVGSDVAKAGWYGRRRWDKKHAGRQSQCSWSGRAPSASDLFVMKNFGQVDGLKSPINQQEKFFGHPEANENGVTGTAMKSQSPR
jgi:hypothetical protein